MVSLEQDAGAEFRLRINTLRRQLESAKTRAEGLETQLASSRQHAEQYKEMSLANEKALAELNKTSEEFRFFKCHTHTMDVSTHVLYIYTVEPLSLYEDTPELRTPL